MLRIGVIGVGQHGERHTSCYRTLEEAGVPISFTGIYDINTGVAQKVASSYGVEAYRDFEHLAENVDAVSVAVPTSLHRDVVIRALSHGIHILVEKPISSTIEEAEEMLSVAKDSGLVLMVGHSERFNGALRALEDKNHSIHPGFIETHRLSTFQPRGTDVSVVLDLMIHDIDIVLHLVAGGKDDDWRPVDIRAKGVGVVSDKPDIANARLEFKNGCVANLTVSRLSKQRLRKVRIFQKNAYISMDMGSQETEIYWLEGFTGESADNEHELYAASMPQIRHEILTSDARHSLEVELESFITAVSRGKTASVSGEEGYRALFVAEKIMNKINKSAIDPVV